MRSAFDGGQGLRVRIGDNELDPEQARDNHIVDGVAAGAADTRDHDMWF